MSDITGSVELVDMSRKDAHPRATLTLVTESVAFPLFGTQLMEIDANVCANPERESELNRNKPYDANKDRENDARN